jgi:hypothetical protein
VKKPVLAPGFFFRAADEVTAAPLIKKSPAEAGLSEENLPNEDTKFSGHHRARHLAHLAVRPVRASASAGRVAGSGSAGRRHLADRLDSDFADSLESSSGVCGGNIVQCRDADPCSCRTTLLCIPRELNFICTWSLEL